MSGHSNGASTLGVRARCRGYLRRAKMKLEGHTSCQIVFSSEEKGEPSVVDSLASKRFRVEKYNENRMRYSLSSAAYGVRGQF